LKIFTPYEETTSTRCINLKRTARVSTWREQKLEETTSSRPCAKRTARVSTWREQKLEETTSSRPCAKTRRMIPERTKQQKTKTWQTYHMTNLSYDYLIIWLTYHMTILSYDYLIILTFILSWCQIDWLLHGKSSFTISQYD
jgi:hypothetical protein